MNPELSYRTDTCNQTKSRSVRRIAGPWGRWYPI